MGIITFSIRDNMKALKDMRRNIFKVHLEGAVDTKMLTEKEVQLAALLGSGLLSEEAVKNEQFRIAGLEKEIEEAKDRIIRSDRATDATEEEIKQNYTMIEIANFFNKIGIQKEEEMQILPGGGLLTKGPHSISE